MAAARHEMPPEIASMSLDEIAERYIGRFATRHRIGKPSRTPRSRATAAPSTALSAPAARASMTTPA